MFWFWCVCNLWVFNFRVWLGYGIGKLEFLVKKWNFGENMKVKNISFDWCVCVNFYSDLLKKVFYWLLFFYVFFSN